MSYTNLTDTTATTRVRSLINEPTALMFSDADIVAFLDEATHVIMRTTLCKEDADNTFALSTSDYDYALSTVCSDGDTISDCIRIEAVLYHGGTNSSTFASTGKCLIKITPRLFRQLNVGTPGPPLYWAEFGGQLYVYPAPSASENGHYCTVLYYKDISDVAKDTSNTLQQLPQYMEEYVIWYAVAKCFERDGKYVQARQYSDIFYNFIMFSRQDTLYKPVDSKSMMKLPDNTQFV